MSHGDGADAEESAISEESPHLCQKASRYALNENLLLASLMLFYQDAPIRPTESARLDVRKVRKERLPFLFFVNTDGNENYPLIVIERSKHPG